MFRAWTPPTEFHPKGDARAVLAIALLGADALGMRTITP